MAEEVKTYTQEEVDAIKAELESKHNATMTKVRKDHENEINKLKLNEEDRLKAEKEEQEKALAEELTSLRAFKRDTIISKRLEKEQLPAYFKNDSRLINANDDKELDTAIKSIKTDYTNAQPKGATHSTVIRGSSNDTKSEKVDGSGFDAIIREVAGR